MSLILEALRKAEAEREIGRVPGLRSQTLQLDEAPLAPRAAAALPPWGWVTIGGLAALLAAAVGWAFWSAAPAPFGDRVAVPPPRAPVAAAAGPAPPTPAVVLTLGAAADARPTELAAMGPAEWGAETRARPVTPLASTRPASTRVAASRTTPSRPATTRPDPPSAPAAPTAPGVASPAPAVAAAPLPTFDQLPDDVRRRLPPVTVDGSAYSADAASRMLIVNGQVVREGDALANGLVLETIQLRSAVLRAGDVRYRITY